MEWKYLPIEKRDLLLLKGANRSLLASILFGQTHKETDDCSNFRHNPTSFPALHFGIVDHDPEFSTSFLTSNEHFSIDRMFPFIYPFIPVKLIPSTKYFCPIKKITIAGSVMIAAPAIIKFHCELNSPRSVMSPKANVNFESLFKYNKG